MAEVSRPLLRYFGGKWLLADWIISNFPPHRVYTEVYGGAASVLLKKDRVYAEVYNDLDSEIVNLFQVLRNESWAEHLIDKIVLTAFSREEFKSAYEEQPTPVDRAWALVVRSFMGISPTACDPARKTGFRFDTKRVGTIPARNWVNYPAALQEIIERLRGVVIENQPALKVLQQHDSPETLHYVDPPYVHETRKMRETNYKHEMSEKDHGDLADVLCKLSGMVVISGYPCPLYDKLFSSWNQVSKRVLAAGDIGGKNRNYDDRGRDETLWINDRAWKKLGDSRLC